jgi:hypothetical protein
MHVFLYYPFTIPKSGYVLGCLKWKAVFFILQKKYFILFLILSPNYTRYTTEKALGKIKPLLPTVY